MDKARLLKAIRDEAARIDRARLSGGNSRDDGDDATVIGRAAATFHQKEEQVNSKIRGSSSVSRSSSISSSSSGSQDASGFRRNDAAKRTLHGPTFTAAGAALVRRDFSELALSKASAGVSTARDAATTIGSSRSRRATSARSSMMNGGSGARAPQTWPLASQTSEAAATPPLTISSRNTAPNQPIRGALLEVESVADAEAAVQKRLALMRSSLSRNKQPPAPPSDLAGSGDISGYFDGSDSHSNRDSSSSSDRSSSPSSRSNSIHGATNERLLADARDSHGRKHDHTGLATALWLWPVALVLALGALAALVLCTRRRRRAAAAWLTRCRAGRAPLLPTSSSSLAAAVPGFHQPSQGRGGRPSALGTAAAATRDTERQNRDRPKFYDKERASPLPMEKDVNNKGSRHRHVPHSDWNKAL